MRFDFWFYSSTVKRGLSGHVVQCQCFAPTKNPQLARPNTKRYNCDILSSGGSWSVYGWVDVRLVCKSIQRVNYYVSVFLNWLILFDHEWVGDYCERGVRIM